MQGQCHDLVVKYGDALIKLLAEDIDPAEICARLGLCPTPALVGAHPAALLDHQAALPQQIQGCNSIDIFNLPSSGPHSVLGHSKFRPVSKPQT